MNKNIAFPYYIFTILFFVLGLFNLLFAYLGFACMITPFVLVYRDRKKTWCQRYCPRAHLFNLLFKGRSLTNRPAPKFMTGDKARLVFLIYFLVNFAVLIISTIMVGIGQVEAINDLRFLMAFRLPFAAPQILASPDLPDFVIHMPYRIYSMMMTTTVIGLLLGWIYKPRTWCTICPVGTISNMAINQQRS